MPLGGQTGKRVGCVKQPTRGPDRTPEDPMFEPNKLNGMKMGDVKNLPPSSREVIDLVCSIASVARHEMLALTDPAQCRLFTAALVTALAHELVAITITTTGGDHRKIEAELALHRIAMQQMANDMLDRIERSMPPHIRSARELRMAATSQDQIDAAFDRASDTLLAGFEELKKGSLPPAA